MTTLPWSSAAAEVTDSSGCRVTRQREEWTPLVVRRRTAVVAVTGGSTSETAPDESVRAPATVDQWPENICSATLDRRTGSPLSDVTTPANATDSPGSALCVEPEIESEAGTAGGTRVGVEEGVSVGVGVGSAVGVGEALGVGVALGVALGVDVGVGFGGWECVAEGVGGWLAECEGVADGAPDSDGVGVGVWDVSVLATWSSAWCFGAGGGGGATGPSARCANCWIGSGR